MFKRMVVIVLALSVTIFLSCKNPVSDDKPGTPPPELSTLKLSVSAGTSKVRTQPSASIIRAVDYGGI